MAGWKPSGQAQETPQNLPATDQAENQDTVMRIRNPRLMELTSQTETSTAPIPKALARQTRARKAVEAADKMPTIAKQRMKETMEELKQANSAVEIAKKKVGPATGLASDVAMLLELETAPGTEGDVKVVRMQEVRRKEGTNGERPPGIQLTQLDIPATDAQEMASQTQGLEAMRQAEEEEEERTKRARIDAGKSPKNSSLTESLNIASNSIRDQRLETTMNTASSSSSSSLTSKDTARTNEKPNDKEIIEEESNGVTETLMRAVGIDGSELDETVKTSIAKSGPRPLEARIKAK